MIITRPATYLHRRWSHITAEFRLLWKHYVYQSLLATVVLAIVLAVLRAEHAVVVASIGATAFIVFTMPGLSTARPRRIIGGHIIGLIIGSLCFLFPHASTASSIIVYSASVGISMFLMVALDAEHPPASGTALGVAISGFSPAIILTVLTASILLALAHRYLHKYLRNLT
ncbi:MAG: HPP family protein [Dehalococcoidales bacterium]|nr:HPP family protein [Dehalococcoidales bacterium]